MKELRKSGEKHLEPSTCGELLFSINVVSFHPHVLAFDSERRQTERLVESRQVSEACKSLEESMVKFVGELKQEVHLRGDLHTVRTMKDQHIVSLLTN